MIESSRLAGVASEQVTQTLKLEGARLDLRAGYSRLLRPKFLLQRLECQRPAPSLGQGGRITGNPDTWLAHEAARLQNQVSRSTATTITSSVVRLGM